MRRFKKRLRYLWLVEISPPSFLPSEVYNKEPEELGERPDPLTQEFREIIGHGRWRWANLTWDAFR